MAHEAGSRFILNVAFSGVARNIQGGVGVGKGSLGVCGGAASLN